MIYAQKKERTKNGHSDLILDAEGITSPRFKVLWKCLESHTCLIEDTQKNVDRSKFSSVSALKSAECV